MEKGIKKIDSRNMINTQLSNKGPTGGGSMKSVYTSESNYDLKEPKVIKKSQIIPDNGHLVSMREIDRKPQIDTRYARNEELISPQKHGKM